VIIRLKVFLFQLILFWVCSKKGLDKLVNICYKVSIVIRKERGEEMNEVMTQKIEKLFDAITKDYEDWARRANIKGRTAQDFRDSLGVIVGNKYIKVTENGNQMRVWGFVGNTETDKKFKFGDILMAAGWKAPARNTARGNVMTEEFSAVQWTGPAYLR